MNINTKKIEKPKETDLKFPVKSKKNRKCPLKYSNWLITVNSQKNTASMNENELNEHIQKFNKVIDNFFNSGIISSFIKFEASKQGETYGLPMDVSQEELLKRVESCDIEYVMETGEEQHKYHCHGLISIKKRGLNTKLDYKKIQGYFEQEMGYKLHVDFRLYTDAKKNLIQYLKK